MLAVEVAFDLHYGFDLVNKVLGTQDLGGSDVATAAEGKDRDNFGRIIVATAVLEGESVDEAVKRAGEFVDDYGHAADFQNVTEAKGLRDRDGSDG